MAIAVPKTPHTYQLVVAYRAVNQLPEAVPWPQPNLTEAVSFFAGATCYVSFDLLQGFWWMPMEEEGEEAFTMVTQQDLFSRGGYRWGC